jgi:predicted nucleic acid-binding protein
MGRARGTGFEKGFKVSSPPVLLADANIFLRFLRNDHPEHSAGAKKLIEAAISGVVVLRVPEIVVADVFYTLTAPQMKIPRPTAARQLAALLQQTGIEILNRADVLETLTLCEIKNVDYGDAALMVEARREKLAIVSYDQDFAKAPEIKALTPIQWLEHEQKRRTS